MCDFKAEGIKWAADHLTIDYQWGFMHLIPDLLLFTWEKSASVTCYWPRTLELKVTVNCSASHGISGTD